MLHDWRLQTQYSSKWFSLSTTPAANNVYTDNHYTTLPTQLWYYKASNVHNILMIFEHGRRCASPIVFGIVSTLLATFSVTVGLILTRANFISCKPFACTSHPRTGSGRRVHKQISLNYTILAGSKQQCNDKVCDGGAAVRNRSI